jgi:hypothetical protein
VLELVRTKTKSFSPEDGTPFPHLPPSMQKGRNRVWERMCAGASRGVECGMDERELAKQLKREGFATPMFDRMRRTRFTGAQS